MITRRQLLTQLSAASAVALVPSAALARRVDVAAENKLTIDKLFELQKPLLDWKWVVIHHTAAEYASKKIGRDVGVLTASTGNRSQIAWIGYADSLDQIAHDGQAMETDPDYLAFFARSEGLMVPNSLQQSIWQFV